MLLRIFLGVTGLLALVAVLAPSSILIGLYLGIFPGILLALAPSLFGLGLIFMLINSVTLPIKQERRRFARGILVILFIGSLLVLPETGNRPMDKDWAALLEKDHPIVPNTLKFDSIAILTSREVVHEDPLKCTGLCQHLLYSGAAKSVSVVAIDNFPALNELDSMMPTIRYYIEHRQSCPPFKDVAPDVEYHGGSVTRGSFNRSGIKERMASGDCLVGAADTLASNEIIAIDAPVYGNTSSHADTSWFGLFEEPIKAHRFAIYRLSPDEKTELFRLTAIWANFLCPVLLVVPRAAMSGKYGDSFDPTLCRWSRVSPNYFSELEQILREKAGIHTERVEGLSRPSQ